MTAICPHCRGDLDPEPWRCLACGRSFPSLRGIPDLRIADDEFLANRDDWAIAKILDADFDRLDFRGLLDRYFELFPEISAESRRRQVAHILSAPGRAIQWVEALENRGRLLDLGCGPAAFLAATAVEFEEASGIDIALRWLILARKRLDEVGLGHVRLVCGCAEGLPFEDGGFDAVVAGDVFEHVQHQAATLAEAHRVLAPGGRIVLASPNRFSLSPEPHVGVLGVGFLPRKAMAGYVRLVSGRDFRAIRCLGLSEWRRLLRDSPFQGGSIRAPMIPNEEIAGFGRLKRVASRAYNGLVGSRFGQWLALRFGPLFQVVASRSASPRAIPATRRRSRRPAGRT